GLAKGEIRVVIDLPDGITKNPDFRIEWERFVPLPVNLGPFGNIFQVFIRKDFPQPTTVRDAIERAVQATEPTPTPPTTPE
ncbi:MAG: hypothetical protein ACKO43_05980, partial [Alphaproteobacteria bacterium]